MHALFHSNVLDRAWTAMATTYRVGTFPTDTILLSTVASAVRLSQTVYRTGRRIPSHAHAEASYVLLLRGDLVERTRGGAFQCGPGTVIVRPPESVHANEFLSESQCCNLEVSPAFYDMWTGLAVPQKVDVLQGGASAWVLRRLCDELVLMDQCSPSSIEALAVDLVTSVTRSMDVSRRIPPWLKEAKELMVTEMSSGIGTDAIARHVGVHPVHLSRTFKAHFGNTIQHELRQMRVRAAAESLRDTDAPITDVAHACGFADQSHLTRSFKLFMGYTPSRYRERFAPRQALASRSRGR